MAATKEGDKERPKGHVTMKTPPIVSQQEWEAAHRQLLVKEKAFTRSRAAFFADLRECVRISWIEIICSLLCGIPEKADCVKSNDEFLGGVAGAPPGFAVKIDQGPKSFGFAADNGDHQGKAERAGTNE